MVGPGLWASPIRYVIGSQPICRYPWHGAVRSQWSRSPWLLWYSWLPVLAQIGQVRIWMDFQLWVCRAHSVDSFQAVGCLSCLEWQGSKLSSELLPKGCSRRACSEVLSSLSTCLYAAEFLSTKAQTTNKKGKKWLPNNFFPGRYPGLTAGSLPVLPGKCQVALLVWAP
eukprot:5093651-Amphidinium_carterae.1